MSETNESTTDSQNVGISLNSDGYWEVKQYELPYPADASPLSVALYEQMQELLEGHIGQLTGKILTFIDSFGDTEIVNKARKDFVREIIKGKRENFNTDIVATCEDLDKWCREFRSNHTITPNELQSGSIEGGTFNKFQRVNTI
jgi:hypothetical protein